MSPTPDPSLTANRKPICFVDSRPIYAVEEALPAAPSTPATPAVGAGTSEVGNGGQGGMSEAKTPVEVAALEAAVADLVTTLDQGIKELAAAMGCEPEDVASALQALIAARCWKRIPRCFNGWAVGLCARPGGHDGDCNPIPTTGLTGGGA